MAEGLIRMGATSTTVDAVKLARDLRSVFDRIRQLDPEVVVVGDQEGVAAQLAIDEEQVRGLVRCISSKGAHADVTLQSLFFSRSPGCSLRLLR